MRPQLVGLFDQDFRSGFEGLMQVSLPIEALKRMVPPRFEACVKALARWRSNLGRGSDEPTCSVR